MPPSEIQRHIPTEFSAWLENAKKEDAQRGSKETPRMDLSQLEDMDYLDKEHFILYFLAEVSKRTKHLKKNDA